MRVEPRFRIQQLLTRWAIYFVGLIVMSFGIVLTIKADFGSAPWDVLHVGLYLQFGLTIGTWSIIVGLIVLALSATITKSLPQLGAFINMLMVGLFIDMFMMLPFLKTPGLLPGKIMMLVIGILIMGYGMGLYISARCGAGPRDSLMIALTDRTRWKVQYIRGVMEVIVLFVGWLLGGPVFLGTVIFSLTIGTIVGFTLPHCQLLSDSIVRKAGKEESIQINHFSN